MKFIIQNQNPKPDKKEEKPRRTKSRWFYVDTFYTDEEEKERMKDPDYRAFKNNKF